MRGSFSDAMLFACLCAAAAKTAPAKGAPAAHEADEADMRAAMQLAALRAQIASLQAQLGGSQPTTTQPAAAAATHSTPTKGDRDALHARLDAMHGEISSRVKLLQNYYAEGEDQSVTGQDAARLVLEHSYALRSGDAHRQGIEFLAHKAARALVWQDRFVVGAMGSSVTAGHDNCLADSYEAQLERLMGPVWAAGGATLEVRNAGQGGGCGDNFANQVPCMRQIVGDDVDEIHYCWTYFEPLHERSIGAALHAGRKPPTVDVAAMYHEAFVRWALLMDRSPAALIIDATDGNPKLSNVHGGIEAACPQNDPSQFAACKREVLHNESGRGTPDCGSKQDAALLRAYGPFGANVLCMANGIAQRGYRGKVWSAVGDNLHNTTREGDRLATNDPRRQSLGVVWRNWHPGPLLFQVRGLGGGTFTPRSQPPHACTPC